MNHKHIISSRLKIITEACSEEHAKKYFYHYSTITHNVIILSMRLLHQFVLLSFALCQGKKKGRPTIKHAQYIKNFYKTLSIEEQRCWYRKIPQCALILLKLSPWKKLLGLQNDQAFITMMGFDANSFDGLLEKFDPIFFWTHGFWCIWNDSRVQVHPWSKERSSAWGLPWVSVSMDMNQGFAECIATCFWSYLY